MSAEVMKEFLVSIGYRVDGSSEKKFTDSVASASKAAVALGAAVTAAAAIAVAAVARIAESFDSLYYVSQRTGASVQNIKGLGYALSQVGGSASQAAGSLENFTASLRTNPGLRQLVADLGVTTKAGGKTRDSLDVMMDTVERLNRKPYHVAVLQAGLFGIDEKTFNTLTTQSAQIKAFREEYSKTAKGIGLDNAAAAKASVAFSQALGSLRATVTAVAEKLGSDLMPILTKYLLMAQGWVSTHLPQIEETVKAIGDGVVHFVKTMGEIVTALKPIGEAFQALAESLTGEKGLKASMELFAYWLVGTWLVKILGAFSALGAGWGAMLLRLGIPIGIGIAASGGGHMNPEGYKEALAKDPSRAQADAELNAQGGSGKRWWKRNMPSWLGGDKAGEGEKSPEAAARRANPAAATAPGASNAPLGPPPAGLLDNIARAEGTYRTGYNTSLAHGKFLPGGVEHDLTSKSLNEILDLGNHMRRQPGNPNSSALGRYQIVGTTLKDAAKALGMDRETTKFDEKTQDQMAHWIARRQGLGAWEGFKGHPRERAAAAVALARGDESGGLNPGTPQAPAPQAPPVIVNLPKLAAGVGKFDLGGIAGAPALGSSSWDQRTTNNTVNQETKVEVHGSTDPIAAGKEVARHQTQISSSAIRNLQSSIR